MSVIGCHFLGSFENDKVQLEIYECDSCGYHIGFDATHLEQVEETAKVSCPGCSNNLEVEP